MKFFISIGLVLTLSCSLSKAAEYVPFNMTNFATKMWNLDFNRIAESPSTYMLDLSNVGTSLFSYFDENVILSGAYTYNEVKSLCKSFSPYVGVDESTTDRSALINGYLDKIMSTPLMQEAVQDFMNSGYVTDESDFRSQLQTAFFELHPHAEHEEDDHSTHAVVDDSCGFELSFCGELEDTLTEKRVHGLHSWTMFYENEQISACTYNNYFEDTLVDGTSHNLHVNYDCFAKESMYPGSSVIMFGPSPEFDMAIHMACLYQMDPLKDHVFCEFGLEAINFFSHVDTTMGGAHISEACYEFEHDHLL